MTILLNCFQSFVLMQLDADLADSDDELEADEDDDSDAASDSAEDDEDDYEDGVVMGDSFSEVSSCGRAGFFSHPIVKICSRLAL